MKSLLFTALHFRVLSPHSRPIEAVERQEQDPSRYTKIHCFLLVPGHTTLVSHRACVACFTAGLLACAHVDCDEFEFIR